VCAGNSSSDESDVPDLPLGAADAVKKESHEDPKRRPSHTEEAAEKALAEVDAQVRLCEVLLVVCVSSSVLIKSD